MRRLVTAGVLAVVTILAPAVSIAQSVPFSVRLGDRVSIGELRLVGTSVEAGRLNLMLNLHAPTILADIDAELVSRGKLRDDPFAVRWQGGTRLLGGLPDGRVHLTSRVGIRFAFDYDGFDVETFLTPSWDPTTRQVLVTVAIANVRNFPGEAEEAIRRNVDPLSRTIRINGLDDPRFAAADPVLSFGQAEASGPAGLVVPLALEIDATAVAALALSLAADDAAKLLHDVFGP
jgi:hypothetical protein